MLLGIETCQKIITAAEECIRTIQAKCEHPTETLFAVAGANTGNWCPQDDCYWQDYRCQLCDKYWREDYQHGVPYGGYTPATEVKEFPTNVGKSV